jgi:hypothetical protein
VSGTKQLCAFISPGVASRNQQLLHRMRRYARSFRRCQSSAISYQHLSFPPPKHEILRLVFASTQHRVVPMVKLARCNSVVSPFLLVYVIMVFTETNKRMKGYAGCSKNMRKVPMLTVRRPRGDPLPSDCALKQFLIVAVFAHQMRFELRAMFLICDDAGQHSQAVDVSSCCLLTYAIAKNRAARDTALGSGQHDTHACGTTLQAKGFSPHDIVNSVS